MVRRGIGEELPLDEMMVSPLSDTSQCSHKRYAGEKKGAGISKKAFWFFFSRWEEGAKTKLLLFLTIFKKYWGGYKRRKTFNR